MRRHVTVIATAAFTLGMVGVVLASGGEGHQVDSGVVLKDFLYRCLNFAILAGLLGFFLAKPVRQGLAGRREGIEKALQDAAQVKADAEARFAEYDVKLSRAAAEIEEIRNAIRKEGEVERERILANAREMAEKIKTEAERAADNEVSRARSELRREAARLAITLAEEMLNKNFTNEDHERMVSEYLQKVGELH